MNITGFSASRNKIKYPNFPSAMRSGLPIPTPATNKGLLPSSDEKMASVEDFAKSISSEDNVSAYSGPVAVDTMGSCKKN